MASESRDETGVTVDLPPAVAEWVADQADALGVDRETLVARLLAAHHDAATDDGDLDDQIDDAIEAHLADALADRVDDAVADSLADERDEFVDDVQDDVVDDLRDDLARQVEDDVADELRGDLADELRGDVADEVRDDVVDDVREEVLEEVETEVVDDIVDEIVADVDADLEAIHADFTEKIEDVRQRVVQVKKETDAKAPADHDHEELDVVDVLEADLADLADDLDALAADLDDRLEAQDEDLTSLRDRVSEAEERLRKVGWVVSDLQDQVGGRDAHERALDRIRRAAAQEGVQTAECQRCGEAVHVALMTDPECPHCNAAVADVRPEGGLFRSKARLVPPSELEAGDPDGGE